ncbi:hypothetical protein KQI89_07300 [Clostridium sp. MSJ-4]|uniref:Uncharacterized protein n=1 Tax=Clostridium simiarum TaxID=2841506 RepID=A0ABS6EZ97_9CLOT|nr:hypothetical protein [Clostridium simiarum]MBU5591567.1 hypothetical protein [Clostridium simiarum]
MSERLSVDFKLYDTKFKAKLIKDMGDTMAYLNTFLKNLGLEILNLKGKVYSEKEVELYKGIEIKEEVFPEMIKTSTVFEDIKDRIEDCEKVLNYIK